MLFYLQEQMNGSDNTKCKIGIFSIIFDIGKNCKSNFSKARMISMLL